VTRFVEQLFGASQDLGSKLMFAKQKAVGGALAGGPTAASELIENLANLDLITELVGLVGEHLPSGDTAATRGTIEFLRGAATPDELPPLEPLQDAVGTASDAHGDSLRAYKGAQDALTALPVAAARRTLEDERTLTAAIARTTQQVSNLQAELGKAVAPAPTDAEITAVRSKVEAQKQVAAAVKLHDELTAARIVPNQWDEPIDTLEAEIATVALQVAAAVNRVAAAQESAREARAKLASVTSNYNVRRAELEGKLVKEESCAFCGKDLKDIPEVALVNNPLTQQLADLKANYDSALEDLAATIKDLGAGLEKHVAEKSLQESTLRELNAVMAAHNKAELLYARAAMFIELDRSHVPATWTWTGPEEGGVDLAPKLRELEADRDRALRAAATRSAQQTQLAGLQQQLAADREELRKLDPEDARAVLDQEAALQRQVQSALEAAQRDERALAAAQQALEMERVRQKQVLEQAEKARAQLAMAEAQLAEMEANNLLVKKLRAARPEIADKLWSIILAATSGYYAQMRGMPGALSREDGRFKINGKPVTGMSGAEEDILGLAVRIALTRTFLPNVDFLVLDEVAAACDDERENAILALLSTVGFKQVILVTHSPQVDAFGDNIITL